MSMRSASSLVPAVRMRYRPARIATPTIFSPSRTAPKYTAGPKLRPALSAVVRPRTRLFSASRAARNAPAIFSNCAGPPGRSSRSAEAPGTLRSYRLRLERLDLDLLDRELAVDRVHADGVARVELALEEHLRERVGDLVLDAARERPRAEVGVVTDRRDVVLRLGRDVERDVL